MRFLKKNKFKRDNLSNETMMNGARLIAAVESKNPVTEQFRTLRTNIDFVSVTKEKFKTLLISSALPSEGKSTISANLAVVYAQQGKKVLLVNADLRRPTVATTFNITTDYGLTNYLADDDNKIDSIIQQTNIENLDVIISGPIPPNPAELLGSKRMAELIMRLKEAYDIVLFDVPPFLIVTDAQVLLGKVDGVVLVVNGGKTTQSALQRTNEILKISNAPVIGFVYNDQNGNDGESSGYGYVY